MGCSCRRRMPAPLSRDGARHWAALPRSRDSGGDGGSARIALSSSSVIAGH